MAMLLFVVVLSLIIDESPTFFQNDLRKIRTESLNNVYNKLNNFTTHAIVEEETFVEAMTAQDRAQHKLASLKKGLQQQQHEGPRSADSLNKQAAAAAEAAELQQQQRSAGLHKQAAAAAAAAAAAMGRMRMCTARAASADEAAAFTQVNLGGGMMLRSARPKKMIVAKDTVSGREVLAPTAAEAAATAAVAAAAATAAAATAAAAAAAALAAAEDPSSEAPAEKARPRAKAIGPAFGASASGVIRLAPTPAPTPKAKAKAKARIKLRSKAPSTSLPALPPYQPAAKSPGGVKRKRAKMIGSILSAPPASSSMMVEHDAENIDEKLAPTLQDHTDENEADYEDLHVEEAVAEDTAEVDRQQLNSLLNSYGVRYSAYLFV